MIVKMTTRGRVTIPRSIREKLNISGGEKLTFNIKDNKFILGLIKKN